jgi:hypothetical protein
VRQPEWKRYIVSVDGVEAKTDCDFLSTVPPKIDKIMESKRYSPGEKVMSFDVTLCAGGDCPIKQNCHRFTAERLGRQDFFGSPPYNFATQSCEYFWPPRPIEEADIQTRAYYIWQTEGCPEGKEEEHWLQARRECEEARRRWG